MSELSPEAKRLFEAAREAYSPSAQRLSELQGVLQVRIAADAAAAGGASSAATGTAKVALAIKAAAVLGVATVALVGASMLGRPEHTAEAPSSTPIVSAPVSAKAALPAKVALPTPAALPAAPSVEPARAAPQLEPAREVVRPARADSRPAAARRGARPTTSSTPSPSAPSSSPSGAAARTPRSAVRVDTTLEAPRPAAQEPAPAPAPDAERAPRAAPSRVISDELDAEVRLLRAARAALESGAAERALSILDEHAAGHPHGTLAQEALATRALALCALGRVSAARAAVRELSRLSPSSPHLARLRTSCAGPDQR